MKRIVIFTVGLIAVCLSTAALADDVGWRTDGSGRYPNASPPTE